MKKRLKRVEQEIKNLSEVVATLISWLPRELGQENAGKLLSKLNIEINRRRENDES